MLSIKQTLITNLSQLDGMTAYSAIVGLLLISGLGVPLPEDITLIAAGILTALGSISIWGAMIVGIFGVLLGDAILYTLGRVYGRRAFQLPVIRTIMTPRRIAMAERRILRNSQLICFTARFLPGLRAPIYLTAGIMGVRPLVFYGLDGLAALISVPVWIWVGHWVGENMDMGIKIADRVQFGLIAFFVVAIAGYLIYRKQYKQRRAQRLMRHMKVLTQDPHLNPK